MKKRIPVLLCVFALLLAGCGERAEVAAETVDIYRVIKTDSQTDGELLRTETVERQTGVTKLNFILQELQRPSADMELGRSLPESVNILSCSRVGSELVIELSAEYLELEGIDKTLTDYCIALTLLGAFDIQTVSVAVDGEIITPGLKADDVLLYDSEESPYEKQVRLYFADREGRYLCAEQHTLSVADDALIERCIMDELLRGPNDEVLTSAIPEGTRLLGISTANNVCTVQLSGEFYTNRPQTYVGERLAIYSIVNSLTALSEVSAVILDIDTMSSERYLYIDTSGELIRCDSVIGPVNSSKGEMDLDLYMALPGMDRLVAVPTIVKRDEYLSVEECAVTALTQANGEGGVISLLSACGEVNFVSTRNGICAVDVESGFFDSCGDNKTLAIEALVATLCAIDGVSGVSLTENGAVLEHDGRVWTGSVTTNKEIILN